MSITIKVGKQSKIQTFPIGTLQAECMPSMKKKTLNQIGKQLVKQLKLKNGGIEILEIVFTYYTPEKEKKK